MHKVTFNWRERIPIRAAVAPRMRNSSPYETPSILPARTLRSIFPVIRNREKYSEIMSNCGLSHLLCSPVYGL